MMRSHRSAKSTRQYSAGTGDSDAPGSNSAARPSGPGRRSRPLSLAVDEHAPSLDWSRDRPGHVKGLSDRVTELSTLMEVSTLLSSNRPLAETLESVCRLASEVCRSQVAFVHLADGGDGLVCVARHGLPESTFAPWEGMARVYGLRAVKRGAPVSAPRVLLCGGDWKASSGGQGMGGICAVPLTGRTEVVGTIVVGYSTGHRFASREKEMLRAIAAQVAMAVERSWLFDRVQEQLARANNLRDVAVHIGSSLDLDVVMDSISDHASRLLAAEVSAVFLAGEPGHAGTPDRPGGDTTVLGACLDGPLGRAVREALATGRTAVAQEDEGGSPSAAAMGESQELRATLAVPLVSGDRPLGVLVACYAEARRFDSTDIALAEDFAAEAAVAIRNALIYMDAMASRVSLESALGQIRNHGIMVLDDELSIRYANPAAFWMLGASPEETAMPLSAWRGLIARSVVSMADLDRALVAMRDNPEQTTVVELTVRGTTESRRTLRLVGVPFRRADGAIHGRVCLLEENG